MNLKDPEIRDALAAEFVLGTLHGPARRHFERLLRDDPSLQQAVSAWEGRLGRLDEGLQAVEPPARVWRAVKGRIREHRGYAPSLWESLVLWRSLTAAALAVSVSLAGILVHQMVRSPAFVPEYVAVVSDEKGQTIWSVSADLDRGELAINPVSTPPLEEGKAFELWLLPARDRPPRSMGLLPTQRRARLTLPSDITLPTAKGIAVSLEPAGGSPTGLPTGPVLYQAALLRSG